MSVIEFYKILKYMIGAQNVALFLMFYRNNTYIYWLFVFNL